MLKYGMQRIVPSIIITILLLFISSAFAVPIETFIKADKLEYDPVKKVYILTGNVEIKRVDANIKAEYIEYNEETLFVKAKTDVFYSDKEVSMLADEADIYIDKKTGKIKNGDITFKKDNYHVTGDEVIKKSESEYFLENATFTTCDADVPEWCFHAKEVNIEVGDYMKAKNINFRVKDFPIFYSPYFRTAIARKTGFLIPTLGFGDDKGSYFKLPFYWVISDNRDATFSLEIHTKRGAGEGVEYRYLERGGIEGHWNVKHQHDREMDKDFVLIKGEHLQFAEEGLSLYLDVNHLSEDEYYKEYSPDMEKTFRRYLETRGEVSYSYKRLRGYLLSEYWEDLRYDREEVSQITPELGLTLNPTRVGPVNLSVTSSIANIWSDEGADGERLLFIPKIYHSMGETFRLKQTAAFKAESYSMSRTAGDENDSDDMTFLYTASADVTFTKKYDSFTHVIEPSLGFTYISDSSEAPVIDYFELLEKRSDLELALMNYFRNDNGTFLFLRLSNPFELLDSANRFGPLKVQVRLNTPVSLTADATYDYHDNELKTVNTELAFNLFNSRIYFGERYDLDYDRMFLTGGIGFRPFKYLTLGADFWHDSKEDGHTNFTVNSTYSRQCWGVNMLFRKKPDDFNFYFTIDLRGLGAYRL